MGAKKKYIDFIKYEAEKEERLLNTMINGTVLMQS